MSVSDEGKIPDYGFLPATVTMYDAILLCSTSPGSVLFLTPKEVAPMALVKDADVACLLLMRGASVLSRYGGAKTIHLDRINTCAYVLEEDQPSPSPNMGDQHL